MQLRLLFGAVLVVAATGAHSARADVGDALRTLRSGTPQEKQVLMLLITGEEDGFEATNRYLSSKRREPPLYCPPAKLSLTSEQLIDILQRFVTAKSAEIPRIDAAPLADALLYALEDALPCRK